MPKKGQAAGRKPPLRGKGSYKQNPGGGSKQAIGRKPPPQPGAKQAAGRKPPPRVKKGTYKRKK